jgi:hypothetical protein
MPANGSEKLVSRTIIAGSARISDKLAPKNALSSLKKFVSGNVRNFSNCLPLLAGKRTIRNDLRGVFRNSGSV